MNNNETETTIVNRVAFQGDVCIKRLRCLPRGVRQNFKRVDTARKVVAHSETGHHHVIDDTGVVMFESPTDPLIAYLMLDSVTETRLVHLRGHDTHGALSLACRGTEKAVFKVTRQREYTPQGWRRAQD